MGLCVQSGALLACTFGLTPSTLTSLSPKVLISAPMATVADSKPMVNIAPFGMCTSLLNPTVASATAAALGVLTPMPCMPNCPAIWLPGSPKVLVSGKPALQNTDTLICAFGGVITVTSPGNTKVAIM